MMCNSVNSCEFFCLEFSQLLESDRFVSHEILEVFSNYFFGYVFSSSLFSSETLMI